MPYYHRTLHIEVLSSNNGMKLMIIFYWLFLADIDIHYRYTLVKAKGQDREWYLTTLKTVSPGFLC